MTYVPSEHELPPALSHVMFTVNNTSC